MSKQDTWWRIQALVPWAWVSTISETWCATRSCRGRWRCKIVSTRYRHGWQVWRLTLVSRGSKTRGTASSHQCCSRRMWSLHHNILAWNKFSILTIYYNYIQDINFWGAIIILSPFRKQWRILKIHRELQKQKVWASALIPIF